MIYQWLTNEQIEELVNPELARKGMAVLNINPVTPTCRVLGAWDGINLVSFLCLQMIPVLGPLVRNDHTVRDNGEISRQLTEKMHEFLNDVQARGYLVIADNPITGRLCERHGMSRVASPVFVADHGKLECNDYTPERVN